MHGSVWQPHDSGHEGSPASQARATDDRLLEDAYERVRPGLLRWLVTLSHDEARAEDCCEEAFVRLLLAVRLGHPPDVPAAWLFEVAHHLLVSDARHRRVVERQRQETAPSPEDHGGDPVGEVVMERERVGEVSRALAGLRPGDRAIVLMAAGGASASQLAAALGISAGAARTRLCRARRRLGHGLPDGR